MRPGAGDSESVARFCTLVLDSTSYSDDFPRQTWSESSSTNRGPNWSTTGEDTAPSKRIMSAYPRYTKTGDGPLVIAEVGLDVIRSACPHANDWLRELETRMSRSVT